ncbi:YajQ family cyclic di-GMP-binding protein [Stomatohabitans albus]|uniref:YajQ family cyclic di-GMP-binding protein n=1 Tax=Stomatohabitans albus TaxID=3110766 RepID=UPI00300C118E
MAQNSFDVVAEVDRQEVDNAVQQTKKEVAQRFDFKGVNANAEWKGDQIVLSANSEERVKAVLDVFQTKAVKRKLSLKSFVTGDPVAGGQGIYRITIDLVAGIPTDKAKAMVKIIKASKLKVTPAIQDDQLRITSKSRDELQEVQALLRANDQDLPLKFTNYK